jgi:5-methylcytosine-specific restriction endonuclease McrA
MPYKDPEKRREYHREYQREYSRRQRAANPEGVREIKSLWRAANPGRENECRRRQRAANPEKARAEGRESSRRQRAANPEGERERGRRYRAAHPEKAHARWRKRRALKLGSGHVPYSETTLDLIYRSQRGLCLYCGKKIARRRTLRGTHLDHMVPVSRGGADSAANVAFACADCDQKKHDSTAEEFLSRRPQAA